MEATGKLSKEGLSPKEFTATKEHAMLDGGTFYWEGWGVELSLHKYENSRCFNAIS